MLQSEQTKKKKKTKHLKRKAKSCQRYEVPSGPVKRGTVRASLDDHYRKKIPLHYVRNIIHFSTRAENS